MTLGQKEMSEVLFPNKNRNVVYQKRELHANSRTFALNSIAKANKVWVVQIFVTQAFKRWPAREYELKSILRFERKVPELLLPWSLAAQQTGRAAQNWSNSHLKETSGFLKKTKQTKPHLVLYFLSLFLIFSAVFVSHLQPHQLWVEIHMGSPVWTPHVEAPVGSARRPVGSTDNQVASIVHVSNAKFGNPLVYQMFCISVPDVCIHASCSGSPQRGLAVPLLPIKPMLVSVAAIVSRIRLMRWR